MGTREGTVTAFAELSCAVTRFHAAGEVRVVHTDNFGWEDANACGDSLNTDPVGVYVL